MSGEVTNLGRIAEDADISGVMYLYDDRSGAIWCKGCGTESAPVDDISVDGITQDVWHVSRNGTLLEVCDSWPAALKRALGETKNDWL